MNLAYVFPRLTVPNHGDIALADSKPGRYRVAGFRGGAYCTHLVRRQDREPIRLATRSSFGVQPGNVAFPGCSPALHTTVGHVLSAGSREQMVWAYARRIVAAVANVGAGGDGATKQFPGNPMSALLAPGEPKATVALSIPGARPRPAPTRDGNLCEEPSQYLRVSVGQRREKIGISHVNPPRKGSRVRLGVEGATSPRAAFIVAQDARGHAPAAPLDALLRVKP